MVQQTFFSKLTHKSWWLPTYAASSVLAIPIQTLVDANIRHMVLDIDDTLVPLRGDQLSPAYIRYFKKVQRAHIARSIDAAVIPHPWWSYKPMRAFYKRVIAQTHEMPGSIVMVGDRVIQDVIGANHAGLTTVLVVPLKRQSGWFSRQYRKYLASRYEDENR
jgi:HAD superfamily phosphatase (TIGR01668 family)